MVGRSRGIGIGCGVIAACLAGLIPASASATTTAFTESGSHPFKVPAGVTSIHVVAIGGKGGDGQSDGGTGGYGAQVTGDLAVTPGETLYAVVGGEGSGSGAGGVNGGGTSGRACDGQGGGGGGASDIRTSQPATLGPGDPSLSSRLLVAAGGGGGAGGDHVNNEAGGAGGVAGSPGEPGANQNRGQKGAPGQAGQAGTSTAGGAGGVGTFEGTGGAAGVLGGGGAAGGEKVNCESQYDVLFSGGGGGGGLYGGGAGGGVTSDDLASGGGGGGGGASGFTSALTNGAIGAASTGSASVTLTYPGSSSGTKRKSKSHSRASGCVVPSLKGDTIARAKTALRKAHCKLGKVTQPHHHKGTLHVVSQHPKKGTHLPAGSPVAVKLK